MAIVTGRLNCPGIDHVGFICGQNGNPIYTGRFDRAAIAGDVDVYAKDGRTVLSRCLDEPRTIRHGGGSGGCNSGAVPTDGPNGAAIGNAEISPGAEAYNSCAG